MQTTTYIHLHRSEDARIRVDENGNITIYRINEYGQDWPVCHLFPPRDDPDGREFTDGERRAWAVRVLASVEYPS